MTSLVVDPELAYADLAARLQALGWEWRGESQTLPTVLGEPEAVSWGLDERDTRIEYTFNPVVMLRVLAFRGPDAERELARAAAFVPHLTPDVIAELVCSEEIECCLLGLFAAKELGLVTLLPLVLARTDDGDDLIAEVAAEVAEQLPRAAAPRWRASLTEQLALLRDSMATPLSLLGDAALRRQLVRSAAATPRADETPARELMLRAALLDPDWETRASAMLWCGRLGLRPAHDAIAALELPSDARHGHGPGDLERLALLRRSVLDILVDRREPDAGLARHAARCIRAGEDGCFDALFSLVYALTTPLVLEYSDSPRPAHVVATDRGLSLARSGLPLMRVSPLEAWLGDAEPAGDGARNPLRRVVPRGGFFLATRPLSRAFVRWIRVGGRGPTGGARPDDADDFEATFDEAREIAAALATIEGASIELPSADQWELGARGTDARRYPWGNGLESHPERRGSPWGLVGMTGRSAEWTRSASREAIACGGVTFACSERSERSPAERLPMRVVAR